MGDPLYFLGFAWDWAGLVVAVLLLSWVVVSSAWVANWVWWRPKRLERLLEEQGIRGTPYRMIFGDLKENRRMLKEAKSKPLPLSHDIAPRVVPLTHQTMNKYGKMSINWLGPRPRVTIMDPELVREILSNKFGHFEKPKMNPIGKLLARGLANYEGEQWARHRRIISPAFHVEKLKCMLPAFFMCSSELIKRWENLVDPGGSCEIDVWPELQSFTADVISRTAFGSSFEEGKRIFQLQSEQAELVVLAFQTVYIPGYRFFPTKQNKRRNEIDREVRTLLRGIIKKRETAMEMGIRNDDLLGLLMESNFRISQEGGKNNVGMTTEEVIEECKLFYFAGQETTSVLLTWTIILLSMNTRWQDQARQEVLQVFGENEPQFDGLHHLKIMTMIIFEVLRLYPPGATLLRSTCKRTKLRDFSFPPGVLLELPILLLHHDPEIWGEDVNEFKPERFAEGVSKASNNKMAFLPFGGGPRVCIGQSFAMAEAKMCLSMILQHFSFELSPSYGHAPYTVITLQPQNGAQVILHRL